jgi:hypothetical protein
MKTETEYGFEARAIVQRQPDAARRETEGSFADALKAEVAAKRNEILAAQPAAPVSEHADDIERIKEIGMRAYAEEMHAKKMEELREKILEMMGLTEEDLEAMPADQRKTIEDMIAREIEARVAANTMINGGDEADAAQPGSGQLAAQAIAGESGKLSGGAAGFAVMAVIEADDALDAGDPENPAHLPD